MLLISVHSGSHTPNHVIVRWAYVTSRARAAKQTEVSELSISKRDCTQSFEQLVFVAGLLLPNNLFRVELVRPISEDSLMIGCNKTFVQRQTNNGRLSANTMGA